MENTTIERKKIKGGKYKYFVADENGRILKKIDPQFSDGRPIYPNPEIDRNGYLVEDFDTHIYEFSHISPPSAEEKEIVLPDEWDYRTGKYEPRTIIVSEGSYENIPSKAIIHANGNILISRIIRIEKYIYEKGFLIISLNPEIWIGSWQKAFGKGAILQCVINDTNGDFIIEPYRGKITYLESGGLFRLHDLLYDCEGKLLDLKIAPITLNRKREEEEVIIITKGLYKYGLLMHGQILLEPTYKNIEYSFLENTFIIEDNNKYRFVTFEKNYAEGNKLITGETYYDEIIYLKNYEIYLCRNITERKTDLFLGFNIGVVTINASDEKNLIEIDEKLIALNCKLKEEIIKLYRK